MIYVNLWTGNLVSFRALCGSRNNIRHQMKQTGTNMPVFTDGAIQMIYTASRGIPRVVNQLCTQALYDAAARDSEAIEEGHAQRVLTDQEWQCGTAS